MNPIKHNSNNVMCRPPDGWSHPGLQLPALPATKGTLGGTTVMVTYWEPTAEELAMLLAGGRIQLTCIGGQPACNVSAIPPNEIEASRLILPH